MLNVYTYVKLPIIGENKLLNQNIFDYFPITYVYVDIDFRLFIDNKAENSPSGNKKKIYVVYITYFFLNIATDAQ